ncbi:MAG: phosphatidate cytidylyltransferase [Firmicutes bacterium]|nr:phosphatidate cytidylyltransferase [Bacillota bacterium]MBQ7241682.1 phosphatidate cytidylyltransferase [Bacillota bacterium]MBR0105549.1 phosphatidate cytidylyltransferase [Bacillota bacterium]MBR2594251.1 phosphatidate cytidylyltransferase [Bacillota bacterium]
MRTRLIASAVGLPLVIVCVAFGGYALKALILAISLIGMYEFYNAVSKKNKAIHFIGYIFAIFFVIYSGTIVNTVNYLNVFISVFIVVLLIYSVIFHKTNTVNDTMMTFFGFFYVCFIITHIDLIRNFNYGKYFVWLIFICAWGSDSGAYLVGTKYGRTKLIPSLSPKKTVEGSIGGIAATVVISLIYGLIIYKFFDFGTLRGIYIYPIIGLVGSILAQIGDLAASSIKRNMGIKDYGNLIPGHGGVLDRFDSILLTAPAVYYVMLLMLEV